MPGPSSDHFPDAESERSEQLLSELPEVEVLGLLPGSSNYTFLVRLRPCGSDGLLAVYKPARGESPLWDFPAGTLFRREVAAYRLARRLGWPRIPPSVVRRDVPHGQGALQLFVDAQPGRHFLSSRGRPQAVWRQVAVFDFITNNADRKSGHCLWDRKGRVWLIDHGLTFHTEPKLRTVIWDFAGRPAPEELLADLTRVAGELAEGPLGDELGRLLEPEEMASLSRRLAAVLEPGWRHPAPRSAWSLPWPPV